MIEQILFFALGFFSAGLLTLFISHAVWRRAVRLTTKRVQAALPVSLAEIKADRDQLRAEFAMAARKLEVSVEQLKTRGHLQLVDITRKNDQLRLVLDEVKKRSDTILAMEERERRLRDECLAAETAYGETSRTLKSAEEKLAIAQGKLNEREREANEAHEIGRTREADKAAQQILRLAHVVDKDHDARPIAAKIPSKRGALPEDRQISSDFRPQSTITITQPRNKGA